MSFMALLHQSDAGNIVVDWVLTIPAAAIVAGALFWPIEALF